MKNAVKSFTFVVKFTAKTVVVVFLLEFVLISGELQASLELDGNYYYYYYFLL